MSSIVICKSKLNDILCVEPFDKALSIPKIKEEYTLFGKVYEVLIVDIKDGVVTLTLNTLK